MAARWLDILVSVAGGGPDTGAAGEVSSTYVQHTQRIHDVRNPTYALLTHHRQPARLTLQEV